MSYTLLISESYYDIEDIVYQVIMMIIVNDKSHFIHRADPIYVSVNDGTTSVKSFLNQLSGNRKEIIAVFTTDAYAKLK